MLVVKTCVISYADDMWFANLVVRTVVTGFIKLMYTVLLFPLRSPFHDFVLNKQYGLITLNLA